MVRSTMPMGWYCMALFGLFPNSYWALNNGVARTPPMGWNSWNHYHGGVSADILKATADAFVTKGLKDSGYVYINTDDGWLNLARDSNGNLQPWKNFPGGNAGMLNLSHYIQSKGLKFGIYGAAGMTTCMSRAGGLYHEEADAQTYAMWEVDYLKYDDCGEVNIQSYAKFSAMRDALNRTGRPIVFSYEPHVQVPISWPSAVGNLWRTGGDIGASYSRLLKELVVVNAWASVTGPGAWGDADMLEVGNTGLTDAEARTHFALWCLVKSPLLIGSDVTKIDATNLALLNNKELIAVNQDPLGIQAVKVASYPGKNILHVPDFHQTTAHHQPIGSNDRFDFHYLTACEYNYHNISSSQQWVIDNIPGTKDGVIIRQKKKCLSYSGSGHVSVDNCKSSNSDQVWLASDINVTVGQIFAGDGSCLSVNKSNTTYILTTEKCETEPDECKSHRCANSVLVRQLWYRTPLTQQLISSFTDHHIPPRPAFEKPFMIACDATDKSQSWILNPSETSTTIKSSDGLCLDDQSLEPCTEGKKSQQWQLSASPALNLHLAGDTSTCFGVYNYTGPDVQFRNCKRPNAGHRGSENEQWVYNKSTGQLRSTADQECCGSPERPIPNPLCLAYHMPAPPAMINIPQCLATAPSLNPPTPPVPPPPVDHSLPLQVWAGPLEGNAVVVAFVSAEDIGTNPVKITATWSDLGIPSGQSMKMRDLLLHKDIGVAKGDKITASVSPHDIIVLKLSPT